jgi:hypothetical protein
MMGGGGQIPTTVAPADRPHSHSRIFFLLARVFSRDAADRLLTTKFVAAKNDYRIEYLERCKRDEPEDS